MNNQDLIRDKINLYLKTTGVTAKWVCDHCEPPIPVDVMSRYRNGKKDLYEESLQALSVYLNNHN